MNHAAWIQDVNSTNATCFNNYLFVCHTHDKHLFITYVERKIIQTQKATIMMAFWIFCCWWRCVRA